MISFFVISTRQFVNLSQWRSYQQQVKSTSTISNPLKIFLIFEIVFWFLENDTKIQFKLLLLENLKKKLEKSKYIFFCKENCSRVVIMTDISSRSLMIVTLKEYTERQKAPPVSSQIGDQCRIGKQVIRDHLAFENSDESICIVLKRKDF